MHVVSIGILCSLVTSAHAPPPCYPLRLFFDTDIINRFPRIAPLAATCFCPDKSSAQVPLPRHILLHLAGRRTTNPVLGTRGQATRPCRKGDPKCTSGHLSRRDSGPLYSRLALSLSSNRRCHRNNLELGHRRRTRQASSGRARARAGGRGRVWAKKLVE